MSQSTNAQWHYLAGSEQKGPFSREQMAALVRNGTVTPATLVWTAGMAGWVAFAQSALAREIPPAGAGAPPPPPPGAGAGAYGAQAGAAFGSATQGAAAFASSFQAAAANAAGGSGPAADFVGAVTTCLTKYVVFTGRAARPEFWWFVLFMFLGNIVIAMIDAALMYVGIWFSPLGMIFAFGMMLPALGVSVRRLHDIDRSGWWILIGLVPVVGFIVALVFYCTPGTPGRNRFG